MRISMKEIWHNLDGPPKQSGSPAISIYCVPVFT